MIVSFAFSPAIGAFMLSSLLILLVPQAVLGNPIVKRAIDASTFANLQLFEQFSAAAYCPGNFNTPNGGKKVTCSTGNCPLVQADDVTAVYEFENSLITDVTGYLAIDKTKSLIILAFRGSSSVRNFIADADFPQIPTPSICPTCTADQGFYDSWVEARSGVLAALSTTKAANPSFKVVVTGHSLGGAIAAIAAAEIRNGGTNADLYTYGQPRIGGATTSDYITNQNKGGNFRVTHYDDPVPRLPPLAFGFRHISPEYYIKTGNNVPVTANDINVYTGNVNLGGNTGNLRSLDDLAAHGWYFNEVGACGGSGFEFKD